ncbi:CDP-alcohol phosphatidyltransferase family protein [Lacrimispora sp. 38-1]|uniref:CDP-alcohol phosphatidyltransferase family protein n=1 Tax=Lacrimispora sp. 38-1 TaxID=3125778 RepID=UPI003CF234D4
MKNLPNFLSILRIVLSLALLFVNNNWFLFIIIYLFCGLSDVLDGYIARRYQLKTSLGAKLDSLADFIFLITSITRMIGSYGLIIPNIILVWGLVTAVIRLLNFCITKRKFNQFGMLHTAGNKLTGIIIFFICPWAIMMGDIPPPTIIIPILSALEETFILLKMDNYNPNIYTLLSLSRQCTNIKEGESKDG